MSSQESTTPTRVVPPAEHRRQRQVLRWLALGLIAWLFTAYLILPLWWRRHERRHPALDGSFWITHTANGIPGDAINVALVGSEEDVQCAMLAAGWFPADPITLRSSMRIATATVFHRGYQDAPVSSLYFYGRKQELAFEQPIGKDPRKRHHVRFWKSDQLDDAGRPLWVGSATLDRSVGFSHTTAQVTHHIAREIDPERDKIIDDIRAAGDLLESYWVDDFQEPPQGRNGGGDPWFTDGRLEVGVLKTAP
jgi:hypothetical protein